MRPAFRQDRSGAEVNRMKYESSACCCSCRYPSFFWRTDQVTNQSPTLPCLAWVTGGPGRI